MDSEAEYKPFSLYMYFLMKGDITLNVSLFYIQFLYLYASAARYFNT